MSDYANLYPAGFFHQADGISEWNMGKLKYGDALCAIAYALGFISIEAVRALIPFEGPGRCIPSDGLRAEDQLRRLAQAASRVPRGVLEIGAGRGEVSTAFARYFCPVQTIEPSPGAAEWLERTSAQLFGLPTSPLAQDEGERRYIAARDAVSHAKLADARARGLKSATKVGLVGLAGYIVGGPIWAVLGAVGGMLYDKFSEEGGVP